ncbi:putative ATP-binding cassette transporter [Phyllobacterium sp. YR620]|uniref:ABC transporter ATP-binding protein/permease n=1 Tax=Phyllobacterium sp. YR620 TaxID=1881066 RepID=UPI000891318F|nr:ATP-binding cassette domain-containing protein [Phyllobacterium sp. YR620]SDP89151.1 putative ATP-binding cassette transporter [Phyllobacterium sp. YR620]
MSDMPAGGAYKAQHDSQDYKMGRLFFARAWRLCRPYWTGKHSSQSWLTVGFMVATVFGYVATGGWLTFVTRDMTNALVAKDVPTYVPLLVLTLAINAGHYVSQAGTIYCMGRVTLGWRLWLATYLTDRYLERRTYYSITQDGSIDNPDQRIQQESKVFCDMMVKVPVIFISAGLDIIMQAAIIASISNLLLVAVACFAIVQSVIIFKLFQPTIRQSFDVTVAEADLRYGLLHVRDHAETVAFYRGEPSERHQILERLRTAILKGLAKLAYEFWMTLGISATKVIWLLIPVICLLPSYFAGKVDFGTMTQASLAAATLLGALTLIVNILPSFSDSVPSMVRLAQIDEKFELLAENHKKASGMITHLQGPTIAIDRMSLRAPGSERLLIQDLSLGIGEGRHLAIVGMTGLGKSSLLRAMAGLWNEGAGSITMPPLEQLLFLPQRPYMSLADLRSQLIYPATESDISESELQAILEAVQLPDLAQRHGGFKAQQDWGRILSLGEQQRIAIARVLVSRPRYVFLDEATSAVDVSTERTLYTVLKNSGATLISVGHRPSLLQFHVDVLRLLPAGAWEIMPVEALARDEDEAREIVAAGPAMDRQTANFMEILNCE